MKRKHRIPILSLCLLGLLFLAACSQAAENESKTNTKAVERGNLLLGLTADGTVALPVTNLDFEVEGIIQKIHVSAGDTVKKGDLLAQLDDQDYQLAVTNAQNSLDKANATYDDAVKQHAYKLRTSEKELNDLKKQAGAEFDGYTFQVAIEDAEKALKRKKTALKEAKAADKEEATQASEKQVTEASEAVSDAQTALDRARQNRERAYQEHLENKKNAQETLDLQTENYENEKDSTQTITDATYAIEQAKLELQKAENNLAKTKLYAVKDGQIISVSKGEGETAAATVGGPAMGFGTGGDTSGFMTLCDTSEIYLTSSVSESDIVGLTVEQVVNVTIDSLGETVFKGKVSNISNIPNTDANGITTYTVTVKLDELNTDIRDGMNALMSFVKKELENVLLIPVKAVFVENNKQYVNVVQPDGSYEKRAVSTGLSNGTQTQVVSGLDEGETVAVGKVSES